MGRRKKLLIPIIAILVTVGLSGCVPETASIPGIRARDVMLKLNREFGMEFFPIKDNRVSGRVYFGTDKVWSPSYAFPYKWRYNCTISLTEDALNARVKRIFFDLDCITSVPSDEFLGAVLDYLPRCAAIAYRGARPEEARAWAIAAIRGIDGHQQRGVPLLTVGKVELGLDWTKDNHGLRSVSLRVSLPEKDADEGATFRPPIDWPVIPGLDPDALRRSLEKDWGLVFGDPRYEERPSDCVYYITGEVNHRDTGVVLSCFMEINKDREVRTVSLKARHKVWGVPLTISKSAAGDIAVDYLSYAATLLKYSGADPEAARDWVEKNLPAVCDPLNRPREYIRLTVPGSGVQLKLHWTEDTHALHLDPEGMGG